MNEAIEPLAIRGKSVSAPPTERKLERVLGWAVVLLLLAGCLLVLRPFVSALLWSVVLSFASWPIYQRVLRAVGNRRGLAAFIMAFAMILIVVVPLIILGATLAENIQDFTNSVRRWIENGPPAPPEWLRKLPVVGKKAVDQWQSMATDTSKLWGELRTVVEPLSAFLLKIGLGLGGGLLELAMSVFIAFFLFRGGGTAAARVAEAAERIGGARGRHLLTIAGNTIRGVVYGILGTALVQAIVAGIGFLIAGVPNVALLALLTFFSSIVPVVGTGVVWIPAAIWLFHQGSTGWGVFMVAWGIGVGSLDNFVKPWLISQGSDMPFILIFFGVIGGALTFGFIGFFLGPTLLAVGYRLVQEWSATAIPTTKNLSEAVGTSQTALSQ